MEKQHKKKKMTFKRVKRIVINVFKEIGNSIKELWERFNKLPSHIRTITYVWGSVILAILLIILLTSNNNKQLDLYYSIEDNISQSTVKYLKENQLYPVKDTRLKLDIEVLKEYASLNMTEIKDKKCKGYSVSYYDDESGEYSVKSLIKCDKYTSKEYNDYK